MKKLDNGTVIWNYTNIMDGAKIGRNCNIGSYVEIGPQVEIGDNCKIQAFSFIPNGVKIGSWVFVGPHVVFTNDKHPDLRKKHWEVVPTVVKDGVRIGANATLVCGITIGENALIGAGAVVTKDVPPNSVVAGNPARILKGGKQK